MKLIRKLIGSYNNEEITFENPVVNWQLQEKEEFSVRDGNNPLSEFLPPKYYLEMIIWDNTIGEKAVIKNPTGCLLENERIIVKINKFSRYALEARGVTSNITVIEGRKIDFGNTIRGSVFSSQDRILNIEGRLVGYTPIKIKERIKKRPNILESIKAEYELAFMGNVKSYYHRVIYKEKILHKFVILTNEGKYYAVDFYGEILDHIEENDTITIIKGKINDTTNIIEAKEIAINTKKLPRGLEFPLRKKDFYNVETIEGKVISVTVNIINDENYKNFIIKGKCSSPDSDLIKQLNLLYKEISLVTYSKEFFVPFYIIRIEDNNNNEIKVYFRPIWIDENKTMSCLVPILSINPGNHLFIEGEYKNGNFYASRIYNESLKCQSISIIDFTNYYSTYHKIYDLNDFKDFKNENEYEIEGCIIGKIHKFFLGGDYTSLPSIIFKAIDVDFYMNQVIFPLCLSNNIQVSVKTTINTIKYRTNISQSNPNPIFIEENQHIKVRFNEIINGIIIACSIHNINLSKIN